MLKSSCMSRESDMGIGVEGKCDAPMYHPNFHTLTLVAPQYFNIKPLCPVVPPSRNAFMVGKRETASHVLYVEHILYLHFDCTDTNTKFNSVKMKLDHLS